MDTVTPKPVNLLGDPHEAVRARMARRAFLWRAMLVVLVIGLLGIGYFVWSIRQSAKAAYQMVFLANGQVYIGKLEQQDSTFAVLTDVFYFQSQVDPQTKETKAVLVKRSKEIHAPDRMMLNTQHVISIEPVTSDSSLAKRLAEFKE